MITVTVQWFSVLAEKRGKRSESVHLSENSSGEVLIEKLAKDFPCGKKKFLKEKQTGPGSNFVS